MTIEERIEAAQKLIEEVKAELAAKAAPRRNWPEKVEAGMVFRHKVSDETYIMSYRNNLTCLNDGGVWSGDQGFGNRSDDFTYLGHARDILTIRTDAHEPTGAELLAPECEFSTDRITWERGGKCLEYDAKLGAYLSEKAGWRNYARLAR